MGTCSNELEYTVVEVAQTCVWSDLTSIFISEATMNLTTAKISVDGINKLLPMGLAAEIL